MENITQAVTSRSPVSILHHSHSRSSMSSSSSNSNVSCSFQGLFDAALRDYGQKTGTDIAADPLITRLERCDSPKAILELLQEQVHSFNQFRDEDWNIKLTRWLKSTVDTLHGLSTSVFQNIGPVRLTKSTPFYETSSSTLQIVPPMQAIFTGIGVLLAVCIPFSTCLCLQS